MIESRILFASVITFCSSASAQTATSFASAPAISPDAIDRALGTKFDAVGGIATTVNVGGFVQPFGDNDPTFDARHGQFAITRRTMTGSSGAPTLYVLYENHSHDYRPFAYGSGPDIPNLVATAVSEPGSTGQVNAFQCNLLSYSNGPFAQEDQCINAQVRKHGQSSTWTYNGQNLDMTGLPPQSFAQVGIENDLGGSGPDAAACAYDPYKCNRAAIWLNGRPYPWPDWSPRKAYDAGAIVVGETGGAKYVFIAQKAGTSGTAIPLWRNSGTVADGAIAWKFGTTYAYSIGRGLWFDSAVENPTTTFHWGTPISGDAVVENAFIDTERVTFATPTGAAIRMAPNQAIDFTGNLTAAGQNRHTLRWSQRRGTTGGLGYDIATLSPSTVFAISDTGQTDHQGIVTAASNAALASIAGRTAGFSPSGFTFATNAAASGESDLIYAAAGGMNLYAAANDGSIGKPAMRLNGKGDLTITGHEVSTGPSPTASSGALSASATDRKGTWTGSASGTGATITFAAAYAQAPDCVVSSPTGTLISRYVATATTLTFVIPPTTAARVSYICIE